MTTCGSSIKQSTFAPLLPKRSTLMSFATSVVSVMIEEENEAGSAIDITAEKDGGRYCFKCRYDIDAIGAKSISDFAEAAKSAGYDNRIYVTNSSFLSAAKRAGEEKNVTLWDRNTIDRMYIGVSDSLEDKVVPVRRSKAAYVVAAVVILVIAAAAVYWFVFR